MSMEHRTPLDTLSKYGEAAPPCASPAAHMDVRLIDSIAWTAVAKWSAQLVSWAAFLVVVRLLSPADFGLLGMTVIYLGLMGLLSEFGIGSAIVNLQDLTPEQMKQMNGLALLSACAGLGLSFVVAHPIAYFFRAPELTAVVLVMSSGLLLSGFRAVPQALLQRDMRFKLLAGVESSQTFVQAAAAVTLAALGARYWALVIAGLIGPGVGTVCLAILRQPGFAWPRTRSLRRALSFSWAVLVANLCWYAYSNSDFTIAGRLLGKSVLGVYTLAWTLAMTPGEKVTSLIMRVTPSFFAACQNDRGALRRYMCRITEGISMITVPATVGLALVARDFVRLFFGPKWEAAATPLMLLSVYAALSSSVSILPQVLNAVGEERKGMWNSVIKLAILPGAFYVGSKWGATGIAAIWFLTYPLLNVPLYRWTFHAIELRPGEYLRTLRPAVVGSLVMVMAVLLVKYSGTALPLWGRFATEVLVGFSTYAAVLLTLERERAASYLRAVGNWRKYRLQTS